MERGAEVRQAHAPSSSCDTLYMYAIDIIGNLNAFANGLFNRKIVRASPYHNALAGWIEWNVLLDSSGGPTCVPVKLLTAVVADCLQMHRPH